MSESIRAVERALDVLLCFSMQTPELNMTQISEKVGMHKSTVHRLLATLERRRFVQRDPISGIYRPGIRLLQMSYLALGEINFRQIAIPFMHRLQEQFRETVDLAILDGNDVVFTDVVESPQRVKLAASPGQRLPACSTASGRAILAYLPETEAVRVCEQNNHEFIPFKKVSLDEFIQHLRITRERGFSLDEEMLEEGINAVGAPILSINNKPVGSIAIAGPAYRLDHAKLLEIGPAVAKATAQISRDIRFTATTELGG
jgi:IclR family KDG regulon transcriptional repressor